jgi:hypothetical protein
MDSQKQKHTSGPWAWFGNPDCGSYYLATVHSGRRYVMDFVRKGLQKAQPRFQKNGVMCKADELATFETCHAVGLEAARKDGACYRYDIDGIDHADARLIAAAPEMLEALKWCVHQFQGDSGTGDSHWNDYPEYRAAKAAIAKATTAGSLPN